MYCADNTNWRAINKEDGVKANATAVGSKFPANIMPPRGNSDMLVVTGGTIPVVPPLPVSSKFAPDGNDAWDGDAEGVDLNNDGYYTGACEVVSVCSRPAQAALHRPLAVGHSALDLVVQAGQ